MIYDNKDVENSSECFKRINMGLCEFFQNIGYETAISDFQSLSLRFVIKFVVIPQTLEFHVVFTFTRPKFLIFTGKRIYGRHIGSVISN